MVIIIRINIIMFVNMLIVLINVKRVMNINVEVINKNKLFLNDL